MMSQQENELSQLAALGHLSSSVPIPAVYAIQSCFEIHWSQQWNSFTGSSFP